MTNVNSPHKSSENEYDSNESENVGILTPPLTEKFKENDSDDSYETNKKIPKLDEQHDDTNDKIVLNTNNKNNNKKHKKITTNPTKKRKSLWINMVNTANDYKTIINKSCYVQEVKCTQLNNVNYCRDCSSGDEHSLCRFLGWRKLKKQKNDTIDEAGFLQLDDANKDDFKLWEMETLSARMNISQANLNESLRVLDLIGETFENLLEYEIKMRSNFKNNLSWKRQMLNMRELCDQCNTSIFNGHLACEICGFSVCLKCYDYRIRKLRCRGLKSKDIDDMNWYYCYEYNPKYNQQKQRHEHKPDNLNYMQIIPPQVLNNIHCEYKNLKSFYKDQLENFKNDINKKTVNKNDYALMGYESNQFVVLDGSILQSKTKEERENFLLNIFHKKWEAKKPLVIRGLHHNISSTLWTPESFSNEFGSLNVSLVNCKTGRIINGLTMEKFWKGFESIDEREKDIKGRPMVLKLKDWPNSDDFKQLLPTRFEDLMNSLPIGQYTHRNGNFNLVSNLPDLFCTPDLGPKLYIAYSSAGAPKEATTNLHVDISDAVNVVMYVGVTCKAKGGEEINVETTKEDDKSKENVETNTNIDQNLLKVIKSSNCGEAQFKRFLNGEKPGALWHLFKPEDADKIRTFLLLCDVQKGKAIFNENDPIHDQINYLDQNMLQKLRDDYDVEAFTIIQFLGDAVFIPAGAPHQVKNLNSCIKVAEDFVSPQGIDQCLKITDQFRQLSDKHVNREDKLQIKNIIYHSMKHNLSILKTNCNI